MARAAAGRSRRPPEATTGLGPTARSFLSDEALRLTEMTPSHREESRTGRTVQHPFASLLRQSVNSHRCRVTFPGICFIIVLNFL